MGVVSDIERQLGRLRVLEEADGMPELRTSTMTHIVWCPPEWHAKAKVTLAGLAERHPARTIFLIPEAGRTSEVRAQAELKGFQLPGMAHEVLSEVIQIRLRGDAVHHPGSIVTPLARLRLARVLSLARRADVGESCELEEILGVTDRLVVDSTEWRRAPAAYGDLASLFERTAVSDIAFSRTLPWRRRLADLWPGIATIEKLRVEGPRADAELIAGWLRSRLKREISLTRRDAETVRRSGSTESQRDPRATRSARASCCRVSSTSSVATRCTRRRCGPSASAIR